MLESHSAAGGGETENLLWCGWWGAVQRAAQCCQKQKAKQS